MIAIFSKSAYFHIVHAWEPFPESIMRGRSDRTVGDIESYIEKERALHQKGLSVIGEKLKDIIGGR